MADLYMVVELATNKIVGGPYDFRSANDFAKVYEEETGKFAMIECVEVDG